MLLFHDLLKCFLESVFWDSLCCCFIWLLTKLLQAVFQASILNCWLSQGNNIKLPCKVRLLPVYACQSCQLLWRQSCLENSLGLCFNFANEALLCRSERPNPLCWVSDMLFGNLDRCKGFSIVTDYYTNVVKPVFFCWIVL